MEGEEGSLVEQGGGGGGGYKKNLSSRRGLSKTVFWFNLTLNIEIYFIYVFLFNDYLQFVT